MKKIITLLLVLSTTFALTACGSKGGNTSSSDISGGYSEERNLTSSDKEIFEIAMTDTTGVGYEPISVATQVVSGTNYRFYAKGFAISSDTDEDAKYYEITIFDSLDEDKAPEISDIKEVNER